MADMAENSEKTIVKKTNALFLGLILLYLVLEFFITLISSRDIEMGISASLILSQAALIVPALFFIAAGRLNFMEWAPFKKVKWSTFGLTILFAMCISPFVTWINLLSQLFTTNFVAELAEELFSEPPFLLLLMIGIIGPICEEFTFRGIIFHGLKKSGRVLASIIVSSFFFGLMHMNLNQFSYAFVLGIAFAFLTEATKSLIPPILVHLYINCSNVGLELIADFVYNISDGSSGKLAEVLSETDITKDDIFYIAGIYMIPALIGLVLTIVVFIAICRREGSIEHIKSLFAKKNGGSQEQAAISDGSDEFETHYDELYAQEPNRTAVQKKVPVITASGWIAIAICVVIIFGSDLVLRIMERF